MDLFLQKPDYPLPKPTPPTRRPASAPSKLGWELEGSEFPINLAEALTGDGISPPQCRLFCQRLLSSSEWGSGRGGAPSPQVTLPPETEEE
jgi:hypothetical protein